MAEGSINQEFSARRALSWATVAALCLAALVAIGSILAGDLDDDDWRVICSCIVFAVFAATFASGLALRSRQEENLRTLGLITMALSAIGYVFFLSALWSDDDGLWRVFGAVALTTFAGSHTSLVAGSLRPMDRALVRALGQASIALGAFGCAIGIVAVTGAMDEVDQGWVRLVLVLIVLLLLTTFLPPLLRRLERPAVEGHSGPVPSNALTVELMALADRIEALCARPDVRASEIRLECGRLREIARSQH